MDNARPRNRIGVGNPIGRSNSAASPPRHLLTLCIVPCANFMPSMMVATLGIALPEVRQSFTLSEIEAGSLFSVLMIVAAGTSAVAGRLADKIGRKAMLISGLSFLALGFGLAGASGNRLLFFFFWDSPDWVMASRRRRSTR